MKDIIQTLKIILYLYIIILILVYNDPIRCREWNDKYINHKTEKDVKKQVEFNERVKQLGIEQKKIQKDRDRMHPVKN